MLNSNIESCAKKSYVLGIYVYHQISVVTTYSIKHKIKTISSIQMMEQALLYQRKYI
ncbi:hypothetical protein VCHA43P277_80180 [Vibrio chagasii]|nr:hypothetical protein VCHA34P126_260039 [Vibrio chagasii]CAH7127663.1 hypothetical protein VCHA50P420_100041 [Vibrio chagasii]CAH7196449.1 hypothetical protein VCHA41O247_240007 [Vibrio chagasii]CAH7383937.1 hypothetical protein VCHA43P277_80180 [Vibrio chagasii]